MHQALDNDGHVPSDRDLRTQLGDDRGEDEWSISSISIDQMMQIQQFCREKKSFVGGSAAK
jgi:hypothetical protein